MSSPAGHWLWADIGFDTAKKLWFVNLFNFGGLTQSFVARNIIMKNGYGAQYQWPDQGPNGIWHVRERIFASDVKTIEYDEKGNLVIDSVRVEAVEDVIPDDYAYLTYAYSLKTSRGFVEFYNANNKPVWRINERWILIEDLNRKTIGEYPHIRIRVEKADVRKITVTKTAIMIQG